jgi:DNA-binding winged helix-turn-helix (wHTH) protein
MCLRRVFSGSAETKDTVLLMAAILAGALMRDISMDLPSTVTNHSATRIQFGKFEANLCTGELRRSGMRVRLQSQPFRLLAILVEHPGELVTREKLQEELWGAGTTVDFDHGLSVAINKLREALGDSAENPRFIETLAKRGYRFVAPVTTIGTDTMDRDATDRDAASTQGVESPADSSGPPKLFWPWLAAGLVVVCLVLCALLILR